MEAVRGSIAHEGEVLRVLKSAMPEEFSAAERAASAEVVDD